MMVQLMMSLSRMMLQQRPLILHPEHVGQFLGANKRFLTYLLHSHQVTGGVRINACRRWLTSHGRGSGLLQEAVV